MIVLHVQQPLLNCSIRKLKVNQSESFTNFVFKTTLWLTFFFCSMLSVNSKIGRFVKLIFFAAELAVPSWLRLQRVWSLIPVMEVMIFIPIWPTIRWRTFNIPKRILVSSYILNASGWKLIAFGYENNVSRKSNTHAKRLNWSSFKEAPYGNLDMSQQP